MHALTPSAASGASSSTARSAILARALVLLVLFAGSYAQGAVEIEGLDGEQLANVRAHLSLAELGCAAPVWMVRWRYQQSEREIRAGLEPLGHYDPEIRSTLRFEEDCWHAHFEIEPGEPVRIERVEIEVEGPLADESRIEEWRRGAIRLEGRQLHHGEYESNKARVIEIANELGYFDAEYVTSRIEVDAEAASAAIRLHLSSGERYRFGEVSFSEEPLRRRMLEAYVPFEAGDPYDGRLVGRLRRNLSDSGYFARVQVDANPEEAIDREVPVHVTLTRPRRARTYSVGAGFATDTGPRLRGDLNVRQHNDRGHRSDSRLSLSPVQQTLESNYRIPSLRDPLDDWYQLEAGLTREDTDTSTTQAVRFGARHSYVRGQWIETDFLDLRFDDFDVGDDSGSSRLVILGKNWSRGWGDVTARRPMDAFRFSGELRGASTYTGSDTDFGQLRLNSKYVRRLFGETRLLMRGDLGGTVQREFDDLPPSVRFFTGGDRSVRGYEFRSLGTERDGEVIGGRNLLVGSIELDVGVAPQWSVAAFIDTGSAFREKLEMSTGAGIGARWFSPIGPVRLDIAHPFDDPNNSFRIHISLGPDL